MATDLVIVALPAKDEYVYNISSEKVPHMTLLFLGEGLPEDKIMHVTEYLEHAASQLHRFGMNVDRRGLLGPKDADVLFFSKRWAYRVDQFRSNLLKDNAIKMAYDSVEQYPEWTPHLTLGYPETPAKKDTREYPGIHWINFDRVALWTSDSDGPTFELKSEEYELETAHAGLGAVEEVLKHYGVKGMKWGKRKTSSGVSDGTTRVTQNPKTGKLTGEGGRKIPPHSDAINKVHALQVAKKSGTQALSNQDLQAAVNRMNLEKQFHQLTPKSKRQKSKAFLSKILLGVGSQQATRIANDVAAQQVGKVLAKTK